MDDFACFLRACFVVLSAGLSAPTFPATLDALPGAGPCAGPCAADVRNPRADA